MGTLRRSVAGASPEAGHRTWRRHRRGEGACPPPWRPVDLKCSSTQAQIRPIYRDQMLPQGPERLPHSPK